MQSVPLATNFVYYAGIKCLMLQDTYYAKVMLAYVIDTDLAQMNITD